MSMVESEFCFFEVQVERMFCNAIELTQASLGVAPERFDAVDVRPLIGEFISPVLDAQVLGVADIHEPIVAGPAIGMDDTVEVDTAPNRFAQSVFRDIGDNLGVNTIAPFEHPKDNRLVPRPTSPFAPDATWTEIGFINFYFPPEGVLGFTMLGDAAAEFQVNTIDRAKADPGQLGRIGRSEVHRKGVNDTAENLLTDSGTDVIAVTYGGHRS